MGQQEVDSDGTPAEDSSSSDMNEIVIDGGSNTQSLIQRSLESRELVTVAGAWLSRSLTTRFSTATTVVRQLTLRKMAMAGLRQLVGYRVVQPGVCFVTCCR
uniref:Uncharacterized protein n=1 Tax=Eutreptiella gymnastica TaxID=73025 RepID=A0A7S4GLI1_9EUGL